MSATFNNKREIEKDVVLVTRSQDPNSKALLAQALQNFNCTPLYQMQTCEETEMVSYFYNTVTNLINYYLPPLTVRRHTTGKP